MESALSMENVFSGRVIAAEPLRGGAVFRWESTAAGVLILAALGCTVSPPEVQRHLDGLAHMSEFVGPAGVVGYRGSNTDYHFFATPDGITLTIPKLCWTITNMPVELGLCLPLAFDDGQLGIPSSQWAMDVDLASLQWAIG
jgi:hypothetical protein